MAMTATPIELHKSAAEGRLFRERWSAVYPVDPYYSPALNQDLQRIYEAL